MLEQLIHLHNETETITVAKMLAQVVRAPCTIFFHGDLGAGKTTFIRGFLQACGVTGRIKSPTYALVEVYDLPLQQSAAHFDFYRINSVDELDNLGIDEYFNSTSICLVEWPDKAGSYLSIPDLHCYLSYTGDARLLRIVAASDTGRMLLAQAFGE
jgi:tRNA threonylcarbamoyladenosine biosynthesis protein TsaE